MRWQSRWLRDWWQCWWLRDWRPSHCDILDLDAGVLVVVGTKVPDTDVGAAPADGFVRDGQDRDDEGEGDVGYGDGHNYEDDDRTETLLDLTWHD